jgi:H+/Cl- antiporter ClcA
MSAEPHGELATAEKRASASRPRPRAMIFLLVMASFVGVAVSLAAWCLLELMHQIQTLVFTDLPRDLGYHGGPPDWYYVIVLGLAGVAMALTILRLPGQGGHVPAEGLKIGDTPARPVDLPGVLLAAIATIGLGLVLGPEAPLIALGAGLGLFTIRLVKQDTPQPAQTVIAGAGSFAAVALIFGSPIIAAVLLLEALGLDREKLPVFLLPGLLAAGIGSLVSIGMGSLTGLSDSAYALGALSLPSFATPTLVDFVWTLPLAGGIALVTFGARHVGLRSHRIVIGRPLLMIPCAGILVALLAVVFHAITGRGAGEVLFSGQSALPGLSSGAAAWSVSALVLLVALKALAWGVSMGGFRGGPTFPAIFIGAAAGILASHLPGFDLTGAVGVGIGAGVASMLRLPLSGVVLATLLVSKNGAGSGPLIIVGVVVAYLVTMFLSNRFDRTAEVTPPPEAAPA